MITSKTRYRDCKFLDSEQDVCCHNGDMRAVIGDCTIDCVNYKRGKFDFDELEKSDYR